MLRVKLYLAQLCARRFVLLLALGVGIAVLAWPWPSYAQYLDGSKLNQFAGADKRTSDSNRIDVESFESGQFVGYVMAVHDVYNRLLFCAPDSVKSFQASAVVRKYLQDNPAEWNKPGDIVVSQALQGAFPCPPRR